MKETPFLQGLTGKDMEQWVRATPGEIKNGIQKKKLPMRTIRHWNYLPGKVVDFPTLDGFKTQLDRVLG